MAVPAGAGMGEWGPIRIQQSTSPRGGLGAFFINLFFDFLIFLI